MTYPRLLSFQSYCISLPALDRYIYVFHVFIMPYTAYILSSMSSRIVGIVS